MHSKSAFLADTSQLWEFPRLKSQNSLLKLPLKVSPISIFPAVSRPIIRKTRSHARSSLDLRSSRVSRKASLTPREPLLVTGRSLEGQKPPLRGRMQSSTARVMSVSEASLQMSPLASARSFEPRKTEYAVTKYLMGNPLSSKTNFGYIPRERQEKRSRRLFYNKSIENFLNRFEKKTSRISLTGVALTGSEAEEAVEKPKEPFEAEESLRTRESRDEPPRNKQTSTPFSCPSLEIQREDRTTQRGSSATTQSEFPPTESSVVNITWNRLGFPIHGLPNVGNTCFVNAAVLALLHTKEMKEVWERRDSDAARHLLALLDGDRSTTTVKSLLSHFSGFSDKFQHCAHSFLIAIFKHFSVSSVTPTGNLSPSELVSVYRRSRSEDLFDCIATVSQTYSTCTSCLVSERIGEYSCGSMGWTLSVPIVTQTCKVGERIWFSQLDCFEAKLRPSSDEYRQRLLAIYKENIEYCPENLTQTSIEDSLKSLLRVSHMDSANMMPCSTCCQDTEHFRHTMLVRTGTVLVLHLQRCGDAVMGKDCTEVKVPMTLDMQPFVPDGGEYRLYAVISHIGTLKSGHFWVNLFAKGVWYKYDDYRRQAVKKEDVLNKCAYVLFYRKSCKPSTATGQ